MCTGIRVHFERAVGERVASPLRRSRRVCTDTLVQFEQTGDEAMEEDAASVYGYGYGYRGTL